MTVLVKLHVSSTDDIVNNLIETCDKNYNSTWQSHDLPPHKCVDLVTCDAYYVITHEDREQW